jgi:hypothetical protein
MIDFMRVLKEPYRSASHDELLYDDRGFPTPDIWPMSVYVPLVGTPFVLSIGTHFAIKIRRATPFGAFSACALFEKFHTLF